MLSPAQDITYLKCVYYLTQSVVAVQLSVVMSCVVRNRVVRYHLYLHKQDIIDIDGPLCVY